MEEVQAFHERWAKGDRAKLTREQLAWRKMADPFHFQCKFEVIVNGSKMKSDGWTSSNWHPYPYAERNAEVEEFLSAYNLDQNSAWCFYQAAFKWTGEILYA